MNDLIGNDAWLNGGRAIALSTSYQDGLAQVFGPNPSGDYFMEGGFTGSVVINDVNTSLKAGKDIAFFPFPSIDTQYQALLSVGATSRSPSSTTTRLASSWPTSRAPTRRTRGPPRA